MTFKIFLKDHSFSFIILFFVIVVTVISYHRFMVRNDYVVSYEGECDPSVSSCFIGCEDDECTTEYYYSKVQKYAPDLYEECGLDITDCDEASVCYPNDGKCSIVYCDPQIDGDDMCAEYLPEENYSSYKDIETLTSIEESF